MKSWKSYLSNTLLATSITLASPALSTQAQTSEHPDTNVTNTQPLTHAELYPLAGTLFVAGGAIGHRNSQDLSEKTPEEAFQLVDPHHIMRDMVKSAHAEGKEMVVVTSGSGSKAVLYADEYAEEFGLMKAGKVYKITNREEAENGELAAKIRNGQIPLVFMHGGDQDLFVRNFGGTAICDATIHALQHDKNFTAGCTSASSSALSECMVSADRFGQKGLGILKNWVIDQHIDRIERTGYVREMKRLSDSVKLFPDYSFCCGLQEGTALKITPRGIEVLGCAGKKVTFMNHGKTWDMVVKPEKTYLANYTADRPSEDRSKLSASAAQPESPPDTSITEPMSFGNLLQQMEGVQPGLTP